MIPIRARSTLHVLALCALPGARVALALPLPASARSSRTVYASSDARRVATRRACDDSLWNVDQLFGVQTRVAYLVGRDLEGADARAGLMRDASAATVAIRRQIGRLTTGLDRGATAPRANVERVISQLDALLDNGGATFHGPAARDTSAGFVATWTGFVADSLAPALRDYRNFLRDTYLNHARLEPGLSTVAGGATCYVEKVSRMSGMSPDLDALYDEAVRRRIALAEEIRTVAPDLLGQPMPAVEALRIVRADARFVMTNADTIVATYAAALDRARRALPAAFSKVPDAPLVVRAIPASQAASAAPAQYQRGPLDGSAASVFLVNAYQPGGIARMNITMGVLHEAYPGHHFQRLYSSLNANGRDVQAGNNSAYIEGWGIYAERLGSETGMLDAPLDRFGYLAHLLDVFVALQIDIGMHARGWTRAQAIDTMLVVAGRPRVQAESYADRHAATPGQLASYGIGYLAIIQARESAERALGRKFDLRAFHDVVLSDGMVTLPRLTERVAEWVRSQQ